MSDRRFNISLDLCPICHLWTLKEHREQRYRHEYNKCYSCGYAELKSDTKLRVEFELYVMPFMVTMNKLLK